MHTVGFAIERDALRAKGRRGRFRGTHSSVRPSGGHHPNIGEELDRWSIGERGGKVKGER